jgi:hypothetical protein
MSEATISKRARKKQARETQGQGSTRSDSVASEIGNPLTTSSSPDIDGEFKPRDGPNPFIEVVQKKVRNLTKRKVYCCEGNCTNFALDST